MAFLDRYRRQVALLIRTIPFVAAEQEFALKGGTAINLFLRNMPRLSVDIDLTYLPVADRSRSLSAIDAAMQRVSNEIERRILGARVTPSELRGEGAITKLVVRLDNTQIKIEVTPVLRGTVYDPVMMDVAPAVEEAFGYARMQVVSHADLYAGKIVAALDRQHPRDLFDVRDLLANEGITDDLRRAFIVYAISHDRSLADILAPNRKDIMAEFDRGFTGMTDEPAAVEALIAIRESLIAEMVGNMPAAHRQFMLGFKRGEPDWSLLGVPRAEELPAVKWKLLNLANLSKEKREHMIARLPRQSMVAVSAWLSSFGVDTLSAAVASMFPLV
ncbi:MAG: nucleotidyl transferase AbiEii/AbiGii toxin family protein [Novosphingobium sp.]|nr:nucleotidyl transferase AbiEii/AbiGii toxin family protein [Novosphingobium sp.]MCP5403615.1 nucleotidyl transferase AbiEii/AbiGii toxin family protein [Novosphingobium sp.]